MKTKPIHFFLLIALLFVVAGCASPQEETPTEPVEAVQSPDENLLPNSASHSVCGKDFWINNIASESEASIKLIEESEFDIFHTVDILQGQYVEGQYAYQVWQVEPASVNIEDVTVYLPNFTVLRHTELNGVSRTEAVLNSDELIKAAKNELGKTKPIKVWNTYIWVPSGGQAPYPAWQLLPEKTVCK